MHVLSGKSSTDVAREVGVARLAVGMGTVAADNRGKAFFREAVLGGKGAE